MADRTNRAALWLALPGLLSLLGLVVLPLLGLVPLAFSERGPHDAIEFTFSLVNAKRALGFGLFGYSFDTLRIFGRSLLLSLTTTVFSIALSFPLAFWIKQKSTNERAFYVILLVVPSSVNLVIRTCGWLVLLGPSLPLVHSLENLGIISDPLVPSRLAVMLGMVSAMLPYAALPILSAVERLDESLIDAARDLHASESKVLFHAVLPQLRPALVAAATLVYVPSLGMFLVSDLLGGAKEILIGNLLQLEFGASSDWPYGAMLGLTLVLTSAAALFTLRRFGGGVLPRELG